MENKLGTDEKVSAVGMLCEGSSIRSVERITGIHRDTIMRLGVRMGEGCQRIMDSMMRNLPCRLIQVDEIWAFVGMKQKPGLPQHRGREVGDVWTWGQADVQEQRRYSPPKITGVRRMPVQDFKLGHYLILAGVCLALLGSLALSAPVASAKGQLKYNPAGRFIDLSVLPPGFDCSQIYEKGIDRQENFRAGQIMIACGLSEGGSASGGSGFLGNGFSQWISNLLPTPLFIGGLDSDVILPDGAYPK